MRVIVSALGTLDALDFLFFIGPPRMGEAGRERARPLAPFIVVLDDIDD